MSGHCRGIHWTPDGSAVGAPVRLQPRGQGGGVTIVVGPILSTSSGPALLPGGGRYSVMKWHTTVVGGTPPGRLPDGPHAPSSTVTPLATRTTISRGM